MKAEKIKINLVKSNPNNPRLIKDDKFRKLVESISSFPQMLEIRPIVVNDEMVVIGGNMRLKACIEAGLKEVWIIKATKLTAEQQKEFIIKDNVGFGEWDFDILANEWGVEKIEEWGLNIPNFEPVVDYSILEQDEETEDVEQLMNQLNDGVKKAIMIEFHQDNYETAYELVKFWREQKMDIGLFMIEKLKEQKDKL